ncbi:hypothetical protein C7B80_12170 [Cyanosarcina cf. burmensis CCALA 770]|nr:hypothetical protein C7B80_12170 [Cyanosarcina cf. burmensis CCALA 770]
MHKDFQQELDNIWKQIIEKKPLAFTRYGDGELLLIKGKEVDRNTQAFQQDRWFATKGLSLLGKDLYSTLHHTEANYYYGIPCDRSNTQAKNEYLSLISQTTEYITFANLFINYNYLSFKQRLALLEEEVVVIANEKGFNKNLKPLKIKKFIPIEDNCVYFWEKNSRNFINRLEKLAEYSNTLFFISAGPLAEVIIDCLWNLNQTNRYIDVGSAIDEIIYQQITRPYQIFGHEHANHIGILTLNNQRVLHKLLSNSTDVKVKDGIPSLKEYQELIQSNYFLNIENFSNQFIKFQADILVTYNQKWVKDPLHQWSRQWEYSFTLLRILENLKNHNDNNLIQILDAGSGVTFFPYYLAHLLPNSSISCIDRDNSYIDLFKSINKKYARSVTFLNQDIHNIDAPSNSFDIIYCVSVLEHTENHEKIIQEFKRLLKDEGILIVSFDISLDGKEEISIESADKLLQKLQSIFSIVEQINCQTISDEIRDKDIVTTDKIHCLNHNLLPWQGKYFASLTFSCHLFRKTSERANRSTSKSISFMQDIQSLDTKSEIQKECVFSPENDSEITVILNGYKRPENLDRIYKAVCNQTVPPKEIMLWYNDFHNNQSNVEVTKKCVSALSNHNFGVWARFAYALNATTKYVCIFDDDTIPGNRWFENCLKTIENHDGLLGTIGVIFNSYNYWDYKRYGWANPNESVVKVDLVGHCWFFKREWLTAFWRELKPRGFDFVGEDMHFSYALQKYLNLGTYVPPHPPEDRSLWGSLEGYELGTDSSAISISNKDNAYKKFDDYLKFLLSKGWQLICSSYTEAQVDFEFSEFNVIVLPDWNNVNDFFYQDLTLLIKKVLAYSNDKKIKLWITKSIEIAEEEVNLVFAEIILGLLMNENLLLNQEPEISYITELSNLSWQAFFQHIQIHIALRDENQSIVTQSEIASVPKIYIDDLVNNSIFDILNE